MGSKVERKIRALRQEADMRAHQKMLLILDAIGDKAVKDCSLSHAKFISDFLSNQPEPAPEKPGKKARIAAESSVEPPATEPSPWVRDVEKLLGGNTESDICNSTQVK